ncbi:MAG TPA: MarR family transcriptional regulator, partial [Thermomicrobiales bacterium]|nr:MarR family transcriptional regulator [Thermomicrobiales bacterium]
MAAQLPNDDVLPSDRAQRCAEAALRLMPRFHRWAAARIESNPLDDRLSLRQLATMFALCDGSLSAGALARRMKVTPAVVTGIVDRLERRDYVRRQADPDDRRRQDLALTPTGQDA